METAIKYPSIACYGFLLLSAAVLIQRTALGAPRAGGIDVKSLDGYYLTSDRQADALALIIRFGGTPSKSYDSRQANFTGRYGEFPLVGQAIPIGGTDDGRVPDNQIEFDFMYMEPQDETLLRRSTSVMKAGKVVGLIVREGGTSEDGRKRTPVQYRRVTLTDFVRFQKKQHQ